MKKVLLILLALSNTCLKSNLLGSKIKYEPGGVGSHMAPLILAITHTKGPIMEMGCGHFSTPHLHALCAKNKRFILSTDTSKDWISKFKHLEKDWHKFEYVPVYEDDWQRNPKPKLWDKVGDNIHWSVVLIDHRPGERRVEDIKRLAYKADILVIHDTEEFGEADYKYEPAMSNFKYRVDYDAYSPRTTIVSNFIDITKIFKL